jgi:hypothetical protein
VEEFGPIALFLLWALASLFGKAAQGKKAPRQRPPRPVPQRRDQPASRTGQPSTFEELLAEMRGQLEQAKDMERVEAGTPEPWQRQLPEAEAVEDTTSLEEEPEVVSLEVEPYRAERPAEISQSEAMQVLVQKRIEAADLRNREWRLEDHRRFDQAIREARPVKVVKRLSPAHHSLRQAMIWNEVLQPPVALRDLPRGDSGA